MASILAVDDSASMRQMVSFTLRSSGHQVIEAVDGQDALEKISRSPVDLGLTEQNMQRMEGLSLVRALRGHHLGRSGDRLFDTVDPGGVGKRLLAKIETATPDHGDCGRHVRITRAEYDQLSLNPADFPPVPATRPPP